MRKDFIKAIKHLGDIIICLFVLFEVILFSSLPNIAGCVMTIICWSIYRNIGLRENVVRENLFAWLIFSSMTVYRVLPLIVTFCEGNSISYCFEMPYETFFFETLLYIISALAYYFAIVHSRKTKPNILQRTLLKIGFYATPTDNMLWAMGFCGFIARILTLQQGEIENFSSFDKFMFGFIFLQNAPLLLNFPCLYKSNYSEAIRNNKYVTIYILVIIAIAFATNSRGAIITPLFTLFLLFISSIIVARIDYRKFISKKTVVIVLFSLFIVFPIISDISTAMLAVRGTKKDISRKELFDKTLNLFNDKEALHAVEELKQNEIKIDNYNEGWTEEYVNNFMLNRLCNIRITDITLYHASRVGYGNSMMLDDFIKRLLYLLPSPISGLDKRDIYYSPGDILYALSLNTNIMVGYRVTSHIADGLATFSYWYFPLQFIAFYLQFIFINSFLVINKKNIKYSILGLLSIYSIFIQYKNANGIYGEFNYLIRGYVQVIFIYLLIYNTINILRFKRFKFN